MASKSDPLPADAARDFRRAVAIDPRDPRARYFLAVEKDLAGDHAGAIDDWLHLLADTPQGAPWESDLRRTIAQVGKINHIAVASAIAAIRQPAPHVSAEQAIPGPSPQELRAAITIPPSQQQVMAEAMVERLDTRLQTDTHDVAGWVMLMRSRITLGQPDKASAALKAAITANPEQAGQIRQEVEVLGVK
jgi:cytochrome c-type biogenesis protein CcmH